MSAEKIFFNIFMIMFMGFIFNRYLATQRIVLLGVLFGQFFSFILSLTSMFNNVKPNFLVQLLTSILGIVIPGLIFFYHYFNKNKSFSPYERLEKWLSLINFSANKDNGGQLLLNDGSQDTYGLSNKINIVPEKNVEDLLKGYNTPMEEIPSSVKEGVGQAQKLIGEKAYRKALETYLSIEKHWVDNAVLQFNIANMYLRLKDYQNAIDRYDKAQSVNGQPEQTDSREEERYSRKTAARRIKNILKKVEDYEIVFNTAVCLLSQGKYERAVEMFKKAGDYKGNWISIYEPLATIFETLGRHTEALEMYKNLSEVNPDDFEVQKKVAEFLSELGDYKQAGEYYDKAVKLKPDFVDGYISLGNYLLEKEMYKEAIDWYQAALDIDPDLSAVHYNLGIAFYGNGQEIQALGEYKKAIELNENDYKSYYNLGVILDEMDRREDAILAFEHCLDIKPDFYEASNNIAVILCTLGRYQEAIDAYIKALQYHPFNPELYFSLAVTLECQGKEEHAEELYNKIIKMKPDFSDAYYNLAIIKCSQGNLKNAEECLRKVTEYDMEYHKAYYQLARIYAMSREYGRCIDNLKKAVGFSKEYINKAKTEEVFQGVRKLKGFESIVEFYNVIT